MASAAILAGPQDATINQLIFIKLEPVQIDNKMSNKKNSTLQVLCKNKMATAVIFAEPSTRYNFTIS